MELYQKTAYQISRLLTNSYSTSFSLSSRFFTPSVRSHIYAIYGLVRIADEVVDTYQGADAGKLLDQLENQTNEAIESGYSTNPIIHSFALTVREFKIDSQLITAFFASMRMDLIDIAYTKELYETYIYGSAEVIGLMCLRVFVSGDEAAYQNLADGAARLGSAYQKVNFLRDIAADYQERGRFYFPDTTYQSFDETAKQQVVDDIKKDFTAALPSLLKLPDSSRRATMISYVYYRELLEKLDNSSIETIKANRLRVSSARKLTLMLKALAKDGLTS